ANRLADVHAARHAEDDAADQVNGGDDQAGDGVAANELAGAVHGAVELGLAHQVFAAATGLRFVDHARVQLGVDGHLFAGHGVEGESGCHFGNAAGAFGNDHELDDDQDEENHEPNHEVAADHVVAERRHDHARMPGEKD